MNDLISREKLLNEINLLKKSPWYNKDFAAVKLVRKDAVAIVEMYIKEAPGVTGWIKCSDRLPETSMKNILFVVYTPAWHDLTDDFPEDKRDFPEEIETVSGWVNVFDNGKIRFWNWIVDGGYQATIENEYSEEETGCITYVTHWMPLPEPPKENEE